MNKMYLHLLKDVEFVGFDFFDTLVHRKCHPETIKQIWCKRVCQKYILDISPGDLYNIRKTVERFLENNKKSGEYAYEEMIEEVFKRYFVYFHKKKYKFSQIDCEELKKMEIRIEIENQYIDKKNSELLKILYKKGKKIIIISDFYMGEKEIRLFLENIEIDQYITEIFVSSDRKKCKRNRSLYQELETFLCGKSFLMVGDNYKSDYINAKKMGYKAIWKYYKKEKNRLSKKEIEEKLWNLYKKNKGSFSIYAFGLYLFSDSLYNKIRENDIKNIFFLAREGEFLKIIFEFLLESRKNLNIKTHYFFCSRVATFAPSLDEINKETFEMLFREYKSLSIRKFLLNLNFSKEDIDNIGDFFKNNMDIDIENFSESSEFKQLLANTLFLKKYETNIKSQRKNFQKYLDSFNVNFIEEGLNIVDVGWKGTIQDNIFKYFKGKINIRGYYLGLREEKKLNAKNMKFGLLFSRLPFETYAYKIWEIDFQFWEKVLSASHAGTKKYCSEENIIQFDSDKNNTFNLMKDIQIQMFEIIKELENIFSNSYYNVQDFVEVFSKIHKKMLCDINENELKLYLKLRENHFENFGIFRYENENVRKKGIRIRNPFNLKYIRVMYVRLYRYHLKGCLGLYGDIVYLINSMRRNYE